MPPLETRTDSPGETPEVPQDPRKHWRGTAGSGTHSTQYLRPLHRREKNPERPPSISHGAWRYLRPPERVPEVPVVSREHLPQLEKIQVPATIPRVPQMSQFIPGKPVFPALPRLSSRDRLTPRWHVGQPCGKASWKASWDSLEGKTQIP